MENLLPQNVGSIIDYLSESTEAAQWGTPSCSRIQPATDHGVRDCRSNCLVSPPPPWAVTPERLVHIMNQPRPGIDPEKFSMRGNHLAYEATHGIK